MSRELANLLAKNFISRRDVKAIQRPEGHYLVDAKRDRTGREIERYPWTRQALEDHLAGVKTYGHYLLDTDNTCKFFAFDIDLQTVSKQHPEVKYYYPSRQGEDAWGGELIEFDPREAWRDRSHPSRSWSKYQLKMLAHKLMSTISGELNLPTLAAYSGAKGVHVYAFLDGRSVASEARNGAKLALDFLGDWQAVRGENIFHRRYR